jgi:hypothetical protein
MQHLLARPRTGNNVWHDADDWRYGEPEMRDFERTLYGLHFYSSCQLFVIFVDEAMLRPRGEPTCSDPVPQRCQIGHYGQRTSEPWSLYNLEQRLAERTVRAAALVVYTCPE